MQKMYLRKISAENPGIPCFCFGHSTGGGIILKVPSPLTCLFHMNCASVCVACMSHGSIDFAIGCA